MNTTCTSHEARCIALRPPSHQTDLAMSSLSSGGKAQADSLLWRLSRLAIAVVCAFVHMCLRMRRHNSNGEYESAIRRGSVRSHTRSDIPRPRDALRSAAKARGQVKNSTLLRQHPVCASTLCTLLGHACLWCRERCIQTPVLIRLFTLRYRARSDVSQAGRAWEKRSVRTPVGLSSVVHHRY
jgi:hypothetical protein